MKLVVKEVKTRVLYYIGESHVGESVSITEWDNGDGYYLGFTDHTGQEQVISVYRDQVIAFKALLSRVNIPNPHECGGCQHECDDMSSCTHTCDEVISCKCDCQA